MPYSNAAKFLHWFVAGLIVSQYALARMAEQAEESNNTLGQLALLANHKSVGMTILLLAVIRLIVRFVNKPPALPTTMPKWQQHASYVSHFLLYGLLFALPVTGWLMSSATAYSVSWFNLFVLPDLVAPNESVAERMELVHEGLARALFILALIHILAALKHHFIDRDNVLRRMASPAGWVLFIATAAMAITLLGRFFANPGTKEHTATQTSPRAAQLAASDLPLWRIDYNDSFIKFSGDQAGAPFSGEWQRWQAAIQFDSAQLDKARFDVTIEPDSVFSSDAERDDHIRSADFFNVTEYPQVRYQADQFRASERGFNALGRLEMKGFTNSATLDFQVAELDDGRTVLEGQATLDRLVWNIGAGDWTDTSWVGQEVMVDVRVATLLPDE